MEYLFYRNPWIRAFLPLLLMAVASVAASSLVVEIASKTSIDWLVIPKKVSFYILLFATFFSCVYQVLLSKFDSGILKGLTPKQYVAALRNKVLEESAKKVRELIKEGDLDKLEKATESFKKLFGEGV